MGCGWGSSRRCEGMRVVWPRCLGRDAKRSYGRRRFSDAGEPWRQQETMAVAMGGQRDEMEGGKMNEA